MAWHYVQEAGMLLYASGLDHHYSYQQFSIFFLLSSFLYSLALARLLALLLYLYISHTLVFSLHIY